MKQLIAIGLWLLYSPSGFGEGLAQGITSNLLSKDPSAPQGAAQSAGQGRAQKAGEAQNDGSVGAGVAAGTGSALAAAATPLLASPLPSDQAAGRILMGQAVTEFMQAAADSGSAGDNGNQKNTLTNAAGGDSGSQGQQPQASVLPPSLQQTLTNQGINPQDLVDKIASGQASDPASLMKAMGVDLSSDDLAKAQQVANSRMGRAAPERNGTQETEALKVISTPKEEGSLPEQDPSGGMGFGGGPSSIAMMPKDQPTATAAPSAAANRIAFDVAQNQLQASLVRLPPSVLDSLLPSTGLDAIAWENHLAPMTPQEAEQERELFAKASLERMGVQIPSRRQNIFQKAASAFHGFSRWRRIASL
jgi:hypothetical protein